MVLERDYCSAASVEHCARADPSLFSRFGWHSSHDMRPALHLHFVTKSFALRFASRSKPLFALLLPFLRWWKPQQQTPRTAQLSCKAAWQGHLKQCFWRPSRTHVCECGHVVVRLLLEAGANKNLADSHSEVMQVEVARLLLECCEWKDCQSSAVCSVSSHVVTSCLPGEIFTRHCAVRLLLEAGANKNLADSHSEVMQVEVARLLLEC